MRGVNLLRLAAVCYAICRSYSITLFLYGMRLSTASTIATTFQSENFPLRFFCKQSLNWVINGMPRMVPVQCVREARGFSNLYRTGVFLLFTHTHAARPLALWRHTWDSKHERVCAKAHVWWEKVVHFEGLLDEGLCWRPSSIGEWSSSTSLISWYHHTT